MSSKKDMAASALERQVLIEPVYELDFFMFSWGPDCFSGPGNELLRVRVAILVTFSLSSMSQTDK
jgi:hypothetical protein